MSVALRSSMVMTSRGEGGSLVGQSFAMRFLGYHLKLEAVQC